MSDFLDRLATRAIGGDGLLMPRLPALFEPLAGAPVAPPTVEATAARASRALASPVAEAATEHRRSASSVADAATAVHDPTRPAMPADRFAATAPVESSTGLAPTSVQRPVPVGRPHSQQQRSRGHGFAELQPAVVPAREIHGAADDPNASSLSLRPRHGALLPPASPVFASSHDTTPTPGPSGSPGTTRARATPAARHEARPAEPVIHVSIGRLEVRSSPGNAAPPRRRDEPRPDSLDDYLRQRGKGLP